MFPYRHPMRLLSCNSFTLKELMRRKVEGRDRRKTNPENTKEIEEAEEKMMEY